MKYYDISQEPFQLFGLIRNNGELCRMPEAAAKQVSENVLKYHAFTTGGRLAFRTNSQKVTLSVKYKHILKIENLPLIGIAGFDLYSNGRHKGIFIPPFDIVDQFESTKDLGTTDFKDLLLYFPLYSSVESIQIGLDDDAVVEAYNPYEPGDPIVYYGPSYTHGGCASRPANIYQAMVSRNTGIDYFNMGMDGSALGEPAIAEYIAGMNMRMFVMDYDANAPSAEHLTQTHENFFKIIREKHPNIPIIIMTRPSYREGTQDFERRNVIHQTYMNAKHAGDNNVYFIDGATYFRSVDRDACTADGIHPNDLGFYLIASQVTSVIKDIYRPL